MRPDKCVVCEVPGVALGGRVNLHGNGTRLRTVLGPVVLGGEPQAEEVRVRRYECQPCGAVMVAGPRGIVPGYLYSAMAIGLALLLWGTLRWQDAEVRATLSVNRVSGVSRPERWSTVHRWSRAAASGRIWRTLDYASSGPARELAERVARILCARAGPGASEEERIWSASAHVR